MVTFLTGASSKLSLAAAGSNGELRAAAIGWRLLADEKWAEQVCLRLRLSHMS